MRSLLLSSLVGGLLWWLVAPALGVPGEALYDQLIVNAASSHGLEPAFVKAVIKCESRFNPDAQSPRGAQGLMQLMPGTQAMLGVSDPFDPQHNVTAGTRYLAMLKQTFSGDLQLALAAYNAGPQAVVEAGYTVPAITETQHYVRCVLAAYEQYRQPGATPLLPALRPLTQAADPHQTLMVSPLRLSHQVARVGQRLTVQLEATNTSTRAGHGMVMLNYPGHLVSFIALHAGGQETIAQFPDAGAELSSPGARATMTYQLLWSQWPTWAPGERRTAVIALMPRLAEDMMFHLSVVFDEDSAPAASQRWSAVVRIPFQAAVLADSRYRKLSFPAPVNGGLPIQQKGRGAVNLAPLRPHSDGERAPVKLGALRPHSGGARGAVKLVSGGSGNGRPTPLRPLSGGEGRRDGSVRVSGS